MAETSDISDGFIKKAAFAILILADGQHILFACVAECYQTRYILSITQLKICRRSSACISRPASRELKESSDDLQHLCTAGPQELLRRAMRSSPCPVTSNGNVKHRREWPCKGRMQLVQQRTWLFFRGIRAEASLILESVPLRKLPV